MMQILRAAKRSISRMIPGMRILLYHRVGIVNNDPQLLTVTPDHFKDQLELLRKNFKVIGLKGAIEAPENISSLDRVIIITFDDGYADNFYYAKPLLERYELPATIFVTTGQIGTMREFWWDDLARIFLIQPILPQQLNINIQNESYFWKIESDMHLSLMDSGWNVLNQSGLNSRQKVYVEIAQAIKKCNYLERKEIMTSIYQWAGLDSIGRQDYRVMNKDELRRIISDGLIEIGSHTKNHVSLSAIDEELQYKEINESKKYLEDVLSQKITLFSYPFGQKKDYNKTTIEILKRLNFHMACSNFPGRVYKTTDRFQLPRILIRDWDGDSFEKILMGW
jgi:peptidoglycan/xylan/chitin deacetylase (PgdA/CDA1 family)